MNRINNMKRMTMVGNTALNFGQALDLIKQGKMVQREGWNGKEMFLFQATILDFGVHNKIGDGIKQMVGDIKKNSRTIPHSIGSTIVMKSADNKLVFGWLASQTDLTANDWVETEFIDN